jgi:predicted transcriptional regulator of viral defense system
MQMQRKRNTPTRAAKTAPAGLVRARELEAQGLSRVALRRLVHAGQLQQIARGLYAPRGFEPTEHHGLAVAAALIPNGVVCLLSALQFHGIGTQAPFEVWMAVGVKAHKPTAGNQPLRIVRFSEQALVHGAQTHTLEGVAVRITSPARTVADCFRYRNKIGLDVALEALREYRRSRRSMEELARAAATVHVGSVMRPYLEAIVA